MWQLLFRSWLLTAAIITYAATVAGLFVLGTPWWIALLSITIIALLSFAYIIVSNIHLVKSARSGYAPFTSRSMMTERVARIDISSAFIPTISIKRTIIFFDAPDNRDLVDMIDTMPGHEFHTHHYASRDSTISSVVTVEPHIMAIEWKPKTLILPFIPYVHKSINTSPCIYGPDCFYHSIYVDREVGIATFEIGCPIPLDEAVAFIMPPFQRDISDWIIQEYGIMATARRCPQPTLSPDRKTLSWELYRPQLGKTYVVVGVYAGQHAVLAESAKASAPGRLQRILMRLLTTGLKA